MRKNLGKKIFGLLVTLSMLAALVPVSVSAYAETGTVFNDGTFEYKVLSDTSTVVITKNLIAEKLEGEVIVPGTVEYENATYTVTQLGGVFDTRNSGDKVTGITSLILPDSITKFTGTATFYACKGLKSIHLPANLTGDTTLGQLTNTFYYCSKLTYVEIPAGITNLQGAFGDRDSSTGVGKGIISIKTVVLLGTSQVNFYQDSPAASARAWPSQLGKVTIYYPEGGTPPTRHSGYNTVATLKTYDNYNGSFFYSIDGEIATITGTVLAGEVAIPDALDDKEVSEIGARAFADNTAITAVTIPVCVTSIGEGAFTGCTGITDVYYDGSVEGWNEIAVGNGNDALLGAQIHYGIEPDPVAVESVALDKTEISITEGETATLTATVSPEDATDKSVLWTSSNEAVATVADGVVTAVAEGTATITVTTVDGEKTKECVVTVTKKAAPIDFVIGDLNNDGKVNSKDLTVLARHLAKWIGYETLPYVKQ